MPSERGWLLGRVSALIVGTALVLAPILAPLVELSSQPGAWSVWSEWDRVLRQFKCTVLVMLGSVAIALTFGASAAVLLARTDVPARRLWITLLVLALFIPLPLYTSGWTLIVQFLNWPLPSMWQDEWRRILGAAWLHGLLGVPWAALVIGLGVLWVEPELEETARLEGSVPAVWRRVIWPRCRPFIALAALIVAWTTWHEFTVTDFFKVDTLAEEVYLQLNSGSANDAARATAAALPWAVLFAGLSLWPIRAWRKNCPPRWPSALRRPVYALGKYQALALIWLSLVVALVLLVPLGGLIAKAGLVYSPLTPPTWSFLVLVNEVGKQIITNYEMLLQSLLIGVLTGVLTAMSVLFLIWLTRGTRSGESLVWSVAVILWSIPGPILGLGLLTTIQMLIQTPGGSFWSSWLYSNPSPMPYVWAAYLRYLPLAWAALWPIARLIPPAWEELAILEGASPWRRLWVISWPSLRKPLLWTSLAVGVLSLGEISASKLVVTPGYTPLAHHIFQQLHSGMDTEVAALSLTLMLPVLLGGLAVAWCRPRPLP